MDRRRTRRVRQGLFRSFQEDNQIASKRSFSTSRRRRSRIQNLGTDVSFRIYVFPALVNSSMAELLAKKVSRRDFSIVWIHILLIPFCTFEQFRGHLRGKHINPALQDNVLSPSDFAEYISHVGSSRDMHSIIQLGLIPGGKQVKKG